MRDFSRSRLGELNPVDAAKLHVLAIDVRAKGVILAALIRKSVPNIDIFLVRFFDLFFENLVQLNRSAIQFIRPHRWQTDPGDRNMRGAKRRQDSFDPLSIDLSPTIAERL